LPAVHTVNLPFCTIKYKKSKIHTHTHKGGGLAIFLSEECNNPDIVYISEYHMNENELPNLSVPRYNVAKGFSLKTSS
jgi:hypothetical protein